MWNNFKYWKLIFSTICKENQFTYEQNVPHFYLIFWNKQRKFYCNLFV